MTPSTFRFSISLVWIASAALLASPGCSDDPPGTTGGSGPGSSSSASASSVSGGSGGFGAGGEGGAGGALPGACEDLAAAMSAWVDGHQRCGAGNDCVRLELP